MVETSFAVSRRQPIKARAFGKELYVLSRGREIDRVRVGRVYGTGDATVPPTLLSHLLTARPESSAAGLAHRLLPRYFGKDVIVAIGSQLLPKEVADWLRAAGVYHDFEKYIADVVFCSHLYASKPPQWARWLMPLEMPEEDVRLLASDDFLKTPRRTIFVNFFLENGAPMGMFDILRLLVYPLGYIKCHCELEATRYELEAAERLKSLLKSQTIVNQQVLQAVEKFWIPDVSARLTTSLARTN